MHRRVRVVKAEEEARVKAAAEGAAGGDGKDVRTLLCVVWTDWIQIQVSFLLTPEQISTTYVYKYAMVAHSRSRSWRHA